MKKTKLLAFALAVVMVFSALSVSAFAAYAPLTKAEVAAIEGATVRWNADLTVDGSSGQDGSAKDCKVTITGAGENGADLVLNGNDNSDIVRTIANVGRTPGTDPMFDTKAAVIKAYCATDDAILFGVDNTLIIHKQEFYVVPSGDSWKVVEEGTAGAFKAKAAVNDDNNTISTGGSTFRNVVENVYVCFVVCQFAVFQWLCISPPQERQQCNCGIL